MIFFVVDWVVEGLVRWIMFIKIDWRYGCRGIYSFCFLCKVDKGENVLVLILV